KNGVVSGIGEEQRARGDQGGDLCPGPLKSIDQEHAIAVAVDDLAADVILQITHATDRHGYFDSFIGRGDPKGSSASARAAGYGQALGIDLRTALQAIERADSVPALDPGRGVAASRAPPAVRATVS